MVASQALLDVIAECQRQVDIEGWTPEIDDLHDSGVLAGAGASYALNAACLLHPRVGDPMEAVPDSWLMEESWWKPNMGDDPRRDLIKGAALIIKEIECLDRKK